MNIKLDENMPAGLVTALAALGHEVGTVSQEEIAGQDVVITDKKIRVRWH